MIDSLTNLESIKIIFSHKFSLIFNDYKNQINLLELLLSSNCHRQVTKR